MPIKTLAEFKIERLEILGLDGRADESLAPAIAKDKLLDIYRMMVLCRVFDEKAFKLQRQGRLGTYPQIIGQEATQVVPAFCLQKKDWLIPTYRGQGSYFARGMPLVNSLLYWGGDDRGVSFPEGQNDMIFSIPVGSHLTQAAGLALAAKLRKDPSVVLTYLGDGASSKGDLHEALNFCGVWKLPAIYLVENNQWAISVPRKMQTASETIAQKAIGYKVHGIQVDGNDVLAVYKAVADAVERGRKGDGATLIEAETYRLGDHTTADDASRYRSKEETEAWKAKDPVTRFKKYLLSKGVLDEDTDIRFFKEAERQVQAAIEEYENYPESNPMDIFTNTYAQNPPHVEEQRRELEEILKVKKERQAPVVAHGEGRFP
ncbi:MAG: pyruvate dehydrogenase (acetyl-transferring) E1 component subunit alpha [Elusimicrobia bacterium]|nr:pyruvate dehydrogenase (acetyl-transferring) E1 component subunit alpha [Elusimicrobiota bacterium]